MPLIIEAIEVFCSTNKIGILKCAGIHNGKGKKPRAGCYPASACKTSVTMVVGMPV